MWSDTKEVELPGGMKIIVKKVGYPDKKFLWRNLQAKWNAAVGPLRRRAAAELLAEFGSEQAAIDAIIPTSVDTRTFAAACGMWFLRYDEWHEEWEKRCRDVVTHGVADGANVLQKILDEMDDPDVLDAACSAVADFNSLSPTLGKG